VQAPRAAVTIPVPSRQGEGRIGYQIWLLPADVTLALTRAWIARSLLWAGASHAGPLDICHQIIQRHNFHSMGCKIYDDGPVPPEPRKGST